MLALQGVPLTALAIEPGLEQRPRPNVPAQQPLPSSAQAALSMSIMASRPTAPAAPAPLVALPAPTPVPASPRPRIGLQVGHWKINELPDELAQLRTASGAHVAGYAEPEVNRDIALRVAELLAREGVLVDVLPATVPPGYHADAFISLHCDGSLNPVTRGYKLATPWYTSAASQLLLDAVSEEYGITTGMPLTYNITVDMRGYYAFGYHEHSIDSATPAVIVEMGYLTNAADRELLVGSPDLIAEGLAHGILRYLDGPRATGARAQQ
jgi:hypothetical protein